MPNELHDHIKAGDALRDECIDKVIKMMDCVEPLCSEEHHHEEGEHHHDHSEYDEHVWTSPLNAVEIVKSIADAIQMSDEINADIYPLLDKIYH